ncbi:MAG: BrnT family toxin [Desulfatiglandaceae bacterium]|jgi:uncharacterized protein
MEEEFAHLIGFERDQGNIDKNLIKHDVENWECEQVFFDRPLLVLDDPKHSISENRWAAFGKTDADRHLIVIFTERGNLIRVTPSREMNKKERKFYDEKG